MVNRVLLIGNLGRDPEMRRLENGVAVAKLRMATSENYRDRNGDWQSITEWHDVVLWRSLAERAEASLQKGTLVYVEGKLSHRSWQDQDGNTRYTTEVVASYFRHIRQGRDEASGYSREPDASSQGSTPEAEPASRPEAKSEDKPEVEVDASANPQEADDDLPF